MPVVKAWRTRGKPLIGPLISIDVNVRRLLCNGVLSATSDPATHILSDITVIQSRETSRRRLGGSQNFFGPWRRVERAAQGRRSAVGIHDLGFAFRLFAVAGTGVRKRQVLGWNQNSVSGVEHIDATFSTSADGWTGAINASAQTFISVVPDPETYALMFAGLATLGLLLGRGRRPLVADAPGGVKKQG